MSPDTAHYPGARITSDLDGALAGADVVMVLRIQRERMTEKAQLMTTHEYHDQFGLTAERLMRAKPDAIVMHPGPMNRDVEIAGDVADGPQSVIVQQVTNGLAMRMAILAMVMEARRDR
jgi:aspartate carbamoyltransferase catalytic subunit